MAQSARRPTRFLIRHSSLSRQAEVQSEYPQAWVGPVWSTAVTPVGASAAAGWKCRTPDLKSEGTFLSQT